MALLLSLLFTPHVGAFHDCIQPKGRRLPPGARLMASQNSTCAGGLCVGMHNGPHEGGPAAYPAGSAKDGFLSVYSTMTVPGLPAKMDGICYYIWTDIFFGDVGFGRMNQIVPQLVLGEALDGSSGPPLYKPHWGKHLSWSFGAHYFFEVFNATSNQTEGHAAYGSLFPAQPGETLFTSFRRSETKGWVVEMGAVGDPSRVSRVEIPQPYMGMGVGWPEPTASWDETNYSNVCINGCWELYGANDRDHLPSTGAVYDIRIDSGRSGASKPFPWVTRWDEDEGSQKSCPVSAIREAHNASSQHVYWNITL